MFKLIELPYASLSPVISDQTLSFHHGKHLQGYVDNLNKLISGTEFEGMQLEEIVASSLPAVRHSRPDRESQASEPVEEPTGNPAIFNNAGQILNHNLYFTQFRPSDPEHVEGPTLRHSRPDRESPVPELVEGPTGPLLAQILKQWGTLEAFQTAFEAKGAGLFGSGWVWLAAHEDGTLEILQCPGADNPVARGLRPLLTFDVWEHAYYLDYQNRRPAHLHDLWKIVDWNVVEGRYSAN